MFINIFETFVSCSTLELFSWFLDSSQMQASEGRPRTTGTTNRMGTSEMHSQRSLLPVAHPNLPDSLYEGSFDRVLGLVNQFVDSLNFNVIRNRDFTDFERRIQAEN